MTCTPENAKISRGFVDLADGQAHYRSCGDAGLPTLVMFHGSPGSTVSLTPLMRALSAHRRVIAIDTRGNGDSEPLAKAAPEITDYARAHMAVIDALGVAECDLYGFHTGVSIATEIAIARPAQIRRLILEGVSVFDPSQSSGLINEGHAPDIAPDLEGTQLIRAFTMVRDAYLFWPWWQRKAGNVRGLGLPSAEMVNAETVEILKSSRTYFKSYQAALRYPKRTRLPLLTQPALVCASKSDQLYPFLDEAAALVPGAHKLVLPEMSTETGLAEASRQMAAFLNGRDDFAT